MSAAAAVAVGGLAALAAGLVAFERRGLDPRRLGLVAALAAIAVAGRVLVPVPSAKPVTALCLIAGVSLGPTAGAAVGASSALVSNVFLGQGPWTPWQMLAWALVGASGGLARRALRRRVPLTIAGVAWAFAFGALMNVWMLATFGPELSVEAFVLVEARAIPFDVAHAAATGVLLALAGPTAIRLLDRYAVRLDGRYVTGPPRARSGALPLAAIAAVAALVAAPTAAAGTPQAHAVEYLQSRLGAGGCYAEPGGSPSWSLTGWVAIGLAAHGQRVPGRALECLERSAGSLDSATDLELTILALAAAGGNPRDAAGVDLVARLLRERRGGRIGPFVNSTIFGVLALEAADEPIPAAARRRLARDQLPDGSYGLGTRGDSNLTAAGIQALRAAGYPPRAPAVRRAVGALQRYRNRDGGYALLRGGRSDAQSTAWAAQALVAAGRSPARALAFLRSLQRSDGSFSYSRGRVLTPAWVTAQALAALARRPLPIE